MSASVLPAETLTGEIPVNHEAEDEVTTSTSVFASILMSHIRRIILEIINLLFHYDWFYSLIGRLNSRIKLIESVFLVYPADDAYAYAYVYEHRLKKVVWNPWFAGLLLQNGKITLMFCISANNKGFEASCEHSNLVRVHDRMEHLRILFQAKRKTFAGILPGVLFAKRILREVPEADVTAQAVVQSVDAIIIKDQIHREIPIIVLGGKGFIGRRVVKLLQKRNRTIISVDKEDAWPTHLEGQSIIVINITRRNALDSYTSVMWPGTIVINEVYPEPSAETLAELARRGIVCHHIVGVKALALPSFPNAYAGAIPCCAAWPADKMRAVTANLTPN